MPYAKTAAGIKLYYETSGSGTPVVLVHGNPVDHWIWLYQIPPLSYRYKVVAVDLRAYGRSDQPAEACSIRDLADDLHAVFAQEWLDEAVICGLSIGGSIVIEFALSYPDKVKALVLGRYRLLRRRYRAVHGQNAFKASAKKGCAPTCPNIFQNSCRRRFSHPMLAKS